MDGDTTMSDIPLLNNLVQQAKSLRVWNDSFAAMLNDAAKASFLSTVHLQYISVTMEAITAERESKELKTENKVLKNEFNKVKMESNSVKRENMKVKASDHVETEKQALKTENKELKTKVFAVETENKVLKRGFNKITRVMKQRLLEILLGNTRPWVKRADSAPQLAALRHRPARIHRVYCDYMKKIDISHDETYSPGNKSIDSEVVVVLYLHDSLKPICSGLSSDIHLAPNRRIGNLDIVLLLLNIHESQIVTSNETRGKAVE